MTSPLLAAIARFNPAACSLPGLLTSRTLASRAATALTISRVRSVEPPSATITS
jgi:hypothetical protein